MPGIYRAGKLEPVAEIGTFVMLLGPSGIVDGDSATNVWQVVWSEPIFGPGPHGTVLLWSESSTPPSGYGATLPGGATSGAITAGGTSQPAPTIFNMGRKQLAQIRWQLKVIGTLPGSWAIDDLDVTLAIPAASPRGMLLNGQSRWNSRFQLVQPSDTAQAPAQGANQSNPSAPTSISPPDWTNLTEMYVHEQDFTPTWTLINNGSVSMNSAMAVALDVFGFRLDLAPVNQAPPDWQARPFMGKMMQLPRDLVFVPLSGRPTAASTLS